MNMTAMSVKLVHINGVYSIQSNIHLKREFKSPGLKKKNTLNISNVFVLNGIVWKIQRKERGEKFCLFFFFFRPQGYSINLMPTANFKVQK